MDSVNIKELNDRIQRESSFVDILSMEMNKVIVGQKQLVENLLIGLLANGPWQSTHSLRRWMPNSAEYSSLRTFFLRMLSEQ